MTPERWKQVEELFHAALAQEPGQRAAFLVRASSGDEELRLEVERLLALPAGARVLDLGCGAGRHRLVSELLK